MKAGLKALLALGLGAPSLLPACGPSSPGPSGELASVLAFAAYPGGELVGEWYASSGGGPAPMPGSSGWREYRTSDLPPAIGAHYERLAAANGWAYGASDPKEQLNYGNTLLATLSFKGRLLRIYADDRQGRAIQYGAGLAPVAAPFPPGLSPAPTPMPTPTLGPGPWYVRTEAQLNNR